MSFKSTPQHNGALIQFEKRGLLGKKVIPYQQWGDKAAAGEYASEEGRLAEK